MTTDPQGQPPHVPEYAQPPAAAPNPQYASAPAPGTPTNVLAIISLVASVLGVIAIPILGSIAGVIMGHIASKQIRATGEQGAGLAKAGLIVGYIGLGLWVLGTLAWLAFAVAVVATSGAATSY
jgi:hypothetical protein